MKFSVVINDLKRLPEAWARMQEMRIDKHSEERVSFLEKEAV